MRVIDHAIEAPAPTERDNDLMTSRVTIEDLASAAGVSRQTVTRAMNGMPRISEATRARIIQLADELGYRPSRFASNLARTSKAKVVGFVVDSFRNPYYSELTADLLDSARTRGWQVSVYSHENENELQLVSRLAREVDIIVGYLGEPDEGRLLAAARGVPLVLLGRTAVADDLYSVDFDFEAGFHALFYELRNRGSRHFGLLESHLVRDPYISSTRRHAYEKAADADSHDAVVICDAEAQSVDAGERGMRELLERFPKTDTVIAFSDLMAMGALRGAAAAGYSVPETMRVVGIDGLSLGAVTSPALTSLAIIGADFAENIAEVVDHALANHTSARDHVSVAPSILWRESA